MRNRLICKGYPTVHVKSLNTTYKYGDVFIVDDNDMSQELKGKIKMGLFEVVSSAISGTYKQVNNFFRRNPLPNDRDTSKVNEQKAQKNEPQNTSVLNPEDLAKIVREAVKEELKVHNFQKSSSPSNRVSAKEKPVSQESVLFIRPEENNITGTVSVEGTAEKNESVNDAINKLKNKGKSSGKTSKGN